MGVDDDVVHIALCPIHGLHGERDECYECGGPVEQVAMRPASSQKNIASVDLTFDQIRILHTLVGIGVKSGHLGDTERRHAIAASKELAKGAAALACKDCGERPRQRSNGFCHRCDSYQRKYNRPRSATLN